MYSMIVESKREPWDFGQSMETCCHCLLIHGAPVLFKGVPQLGWLAFMWVKTALFGDDRDGGGGEGSKND